MRCLRPLRGSSGAWRGKGDSPLYEHKKGAGLLGLRSGLAQLCPGLCCVTLSQTGSLSGPQCLHLYPLDWSSSLPLWLRADLRRGHPAQPAQRPFQPSQVTKSRQGPSREELPWVPPAHGHSLSLGPNRAQNLERNRQSSCSQPGQAPNPSQSWPEAKETGSSPRTPRILPWGVYSSVLHASLLPRSTGSQEPWECQRHLTLSLLTPSTAAEGGGRGLPIGEVWGTSSFKWSGARRKGGTASHPRNALSPDLDLIPVANLTHDQMASTCHCSHWAVGSRGESTGTRDLH